MARKEPRWDIPSPFASVTRTEHFAFSPLYMPNLHVQAQLKLLLSWKEICGFTLICFSLTSAKILDLLPSFCSTANTDLAFWSWYKEEWFCNLILQLPSCWSAALLIWGSSICHMFQTSHHEKLLSVSNACTRSDIIHLQLKVANVGECTELCGAGKLPASAQVSAYDM